MVENSYQNSTIAQILEAIINEGTFEGESHSNIADILLSILNHTEYTKEPKSVIADLLLRVKKKIEGEAFEPYDGPYVSRIAEILLSILNETEYNEAPQSRIAELLLELKEELEAYTELTASGSIASFITNVVKPLVNGEFTIEAYQEGTGDPSPVNVRNIVPRREVNIYQRGINLWNEQVKSGYYAAYSGAYVGVAGELCSNNLTPVRPNTTYYFNRSTVIGGSSGVIFYDINGRYLSGQGTAANKAFTTPENCYFIHINLGNTYSTTYNHDVSINYPSSDTSYHAYDANSNDKVVNLGEDVYGGSYNSVSGKLINAMLSVTEWDNVYLQSVNSYGIANYRLGSINTIKPGMTSYCNCLSFQTTPIADTQTEGYYLHPNYIYIRVDTARLPTKNDFITWANQNLQVCATLETFIESNIGGTEIKTFNGANNIFCDTGDTSVTYLYKGTPPEST